VTTPDGAFYIESYIGGTDIINGDLIIGDQVLYQDGILIGTIKKTDERKVIRIK